MKIVKTPKNKYPEDISWGVFSNNVHNELHVCPIDVNGQICNNHVLNVYCPCEPGEEITNNTIVYTHNFICFN